MLSSGLFYLLVVLLILNLPSGFDVPSTLKMSALVGFRPKALITSPHCPSEISPFSDLTNSEKVSRMSAWRQHKEKTDNLLETKSTMYNLCCQIKLVTKLITKLINKSRLLYMHWFTFNLLSTEVILQTRSENHVSRQPLPQMGLLTGKLKICIITHRIIILIYNTNTYQVRVLTVQ